MKPEVAASAQAQAQSGAMARTEIGETVLQTIAEVTRYPRSVLRLEAELEEELGIESVKRAEILGVLGKKLGLAQPRTGSMPQLTTIASVVAAVEQQFFAATTAAPAATIAVRTAA